MIFSELLPVVPVFLLEDLVVIALDDERAREAIEGVERGRAVLVRVIPVRSRRLAGLVRPAFLVCGQLERIHEPAGRVLRELSGVDCRLIGCPQAIAGCLDEGLLLLSVALRHFRPGRGDARLGHHFLEVFDPGRLRRGGVGHDLLEDVVAEAIGIGVRAVKMDVRGARAMEAVGESVLGRIERRIGRLVAAVLRIRLAVRGDERIRKTSCRRPY